jgi:three-Cys-motif partner protein
LATLLALVGIRLHMSMGSRAHGITSPTTCPTAPFSVALAELRKARDTHAERGKTVRLRCVFLEQEPSRFSQLKEFADKVTDADVLPINSKFEPAIPEIIRFLDRDPETFPFIFIDPTGWTGFSMQTIAPLLVRRPCEVLINFMLDFIRRFIEHDFSRDSFLRLFGSDDFDSGIKDLQGWDRDDAIANRYCRSLHEVCGFDHVQRAFVLHPGKDKTHFLLIYGTRHLKGVEVFKETERKAMEAQERSRAKVEVRKRKQPLLDPEEMPESQYYNNLRERYQDQARSVVMSVLNSKRQASYDDLWLPTLSFPMVWESDLREWLKRWRETGLIEYIGLKPNERTLKRDRGHVVRKTADHIVE